MARPVYSALLFEQQGFTASATIGPVPPGQVWVVRDLDAYGNMGPFDTARLYLEGDTGATFVFLDWPNNTESSKEWRGRQVVEDSHSLTLRNLGGAPVDVRISGYILTQP